MEGGLSGPPFPWGSEGSSNNRAAGSWPSMWMAPIPGQTTREGFARLLKQPGSLRGDARLTHAFHASRPVSSGGRLRRGGSGSSDTPKPTLVLGRQVASLVSA